MNIDLLQRIERGTTTVADARSIREQCFAIAHQIADTACFLDALNAMQTIQPRDIVRGYIDALHDIAERLAGDRVNEIYAAEEEAAA